MTPTQALENVVKAWEAIPAGKHRPREIEAWMKNQMWHAVNDAREALGFVRTDRKD